MTDTLGYLSDDPTDNKDATVTPAYTIDALEQIQNKVIGMTIYDLTSETLRVWDGTLWKRVGSGGGSSDPIVVNVDTDYKASTDDDAVVVDSTAADIQITLPLAMAKPGHPIIVVKADATPHQVIVSPSHLGESIGTRGTHSISLANRDDQVKVDPVQTDLWQLE